MGLPKLLIGKAVKAALAALLMLMAVTPVFAEAACLQGCASASEANVDNVALVGITSENNTPTDDGRDRPSQTNHCAFSHGAHTAKLPAPPVLEVECRAAGDKHVPSLHNPLVATDPDNRERPPRA